MSTKHPSPTEKQSEAIAAGQLMAFFGETPESAQQIIDENSVKSAELKQPSGGCLSEVGWFFSGAVLPMGSLAFYRKAAQKSTGNAVLFFFVFTSIIACLTTLGVTLSVYSVSTEIRKGYDNGSIPEIMIANGVAEVDSRQQPIILVDGTAENGNTLLVAIDTNGQITAIDQSVYNQGLLLTRTELHFLSRGDYRVVPLSEINKFFEKDPLYINAETVTQAWATISGIFAIVALIGLWIWHFLLRLMIIAIYALVLWGIVSMARSNTDFGPILITGIYAIVPAIYISHLFSRSGITFPGLQTFFLFIFWTIGLVASLMDHPMLKAERPLRGWTALIGAPMLLLFVADLIFTIPDPYGKIALWAVVVFTFITLAGVRGFFRYQESQPPSNITPSM